MEPTGVLEPGQVRIEFNGTTQNAAVEWETVNYRHQHEGSFTDSSIF